MYKYVLNSVAKISMMFAKYFEYYTIILRGPFFSWTRCTTVAFVDVLSNSPLPFILLGWLLNNRHATQTSLVAVRQRFKFNLAMTIC